MISDRVIIGICGGVGPSAGILLHQAILTSTISGGVDQGHLNVCHVSRSADVADRTEYLLGNGDVNPAEGLARTAGSIKATCVARSARAVIGVPCNTFHAPPIWNEFLRICKREGYIDEHDTLLNILDETMLMIKDTYPHCKKVGLLSTTGTTASRVYHNVFEPNGFSIIQVPEHIQPDVHDAIYHNSYGIKATAPNVSETTIQKFHGFARLLEKEGAQVVILGCTEIPFAFQGVSKIGNATLVDPITALARALIKNAAPDKLKPLD